MNASALFLAALLAVAAARPQEYHDDVFHFSTKVHPETFGKTIQVQQVQQPIYKQTIVKEVQQQPAASILVKSAPVVSQYVQKVQAQPVYQQVYQVQQQQPSVLVRTVEQEVPAFQRVHQIHTVQQAAPTVTVATVASRAAVAPQYNQYSNQYSNQYASQYSSAHPNFKILKQVQEFDPIGFYKADYQTENGIAFAEQGSVKDVQAQEGPVAAKEGSYSYTGPDGVVYTVNYIADEFGFRASGAHLPVAPAIPAEIQESLKIIASQPEKYDEDGNLKL